MLYVTTGDARDTALSPDPGSLAGKIAIPFEATYDASKGGLHQWSMALRQELEGTGVGVTSILPSYITEVGQAADHGLEPTGLFPGGHGAPDQRREHRGLLGHGFGVLLAHGAVDHGIDRLTYLSCVKADISGPDAVRINAKLRVP